MSELKNMEMQALLQFENLEISISQLKSKILVGK